MQIQIGVEVIFFDLISKHKARSAIICGLSGSKVNERVVPENYVAIRVWEVCMLMPLPPVSIKCNILVKHHRR